MISWFMQEIYHAHHICHRRWFPWLHGAYALRPTVGTDV